ncbi:MAG: hypothetical protein QF371_10500, partial [Flavobacteriales bacterium]|nr:hypothetical protein [Flavobacteriales bacterium]
KWNQYAANSRSNSSLHKKTRDKKQEKWRQKTVYAMLLRRARRRDKDERGGDGAPQKVKRSPAKTQGKRIQPNGLDPGAV